MLVPWPLLKELFRSQGCELTGNSFIKLVKHRHEVGAYRSYGVERRIQSKHVTRLESKDSWFIGYEISPRVDYYV